MKTIFYCGLFSKFHVDFLTNLIAFNKDIKEVIVISDGYKLEATNDIKITYIDYNELLNVKSLNESISDFNVLNFSSEELFNSLKMMNRLHEIDSKSFESRMDILFNYAGFWNKIFNDSQVDIAIFSNRPHEVYDYIAQCILASKNIDTYCFFQTNFMGYYEVINLNKNEKVRIHDNIDKQDKTLFDKAIYSYTNENKVPFYLQKQSKIRLFRKKLDGFKKTFKLFGIYSLPKIIKSFINSKIRYFINKVYLNRLSITPDLNSNFIFVPLHYQPELTTCPTGGMYVYQEIMIKKLHSILPKNWKIYVKEHPSQNLGTVRSLKFYKKINSLSNVKFVNIKFDSYELLNKCKVIAVVTGTLGFEGITKGIPTLVFGDVFFNDAPSVINFDKNIQLDSISREIREKVDIQEIHDYLNKKHFNLKYGYTDPSYKNHIDIDYYTNILNMSQIISNKLI